MILPPNLLISTFLLIRLVFVDASPVNLQKTESSLSLSTRDAGKNVGYVYAANEKAAKQLEAAKTVTDQAYGHVVFKPVRVGISPSYRELFARPASFSNGHWICPVTSLPSSNFFKREVVKKLYAPAKSGLVDYIKKQKGGFDPDSTLIFLHEPYDKDTYTTFIPPKFVEPSNDLGLIITKCYSPEDQEKEGLTRAKAPVAPWHEWGISDWPLDLVYPNGAKPYPVSGSFPS